MNTRALTPQTSTDFADLGVAALRAHRHDDARTAFTQALALDGNCLLAHKGLAYLRFPGDDYYQRLTQIHHALRPRTYVEIGVETGASMALALAGTKCVGIDPDPDITSVLPPDTEIFAMRSSDFFAKYDLASVLGGRPVELGFIDGSHIFENTLEDFLNLERFCSRGGTILIHDCLPLDEATAARARETLFWTGDVWRVLPTLARFRPDLSLAVVECLPTGLAIIRGLDPQSSFSLDKCPEALSFGLNLAFQESRAFETYGIKTIKNNWDEIARALGAA